jgi:hypothetical protein
VERQSKKPIANQTLAVGQMIYMYPVHVPPTMDEPGFGQTKSAYVVTTTVDHDNHRVAWETAGLPKFLLHAERWQILTVVGDGKVEYHTFEPFNGLLAYILKWFMKDKLQSGLEAVADGLKARAESAAQNNTS